MNLSNLLFNFVDHGKSVVIIGRKRTDETLIYCGRKCDVPFDFLFFDVDRFSIEDGHLSVVVII